MQDAAQKAVEAGLKALKAAGGQKRGAQGAGRPGCHGAAHRQVSAGRWAALSGKTSLTGAPGPAPARFCFKPMCTRPRWTKAYTTSSIIIDAPIVFPSGESAVLGAQEF